MSDIIVFINGKFIPLKNGKVSFRDAAFQFGDGIFETIRFENRKLFLVQKHINRLKKSLNILDLDLNKTDSEIKKILNEVIRANKLNSGLLRLMITRGNIDGKPWDYKGEAGIYVSIRNINKIESNKVKVLFYNESNYPIIRFNPAIKSMNYIGNMKAKKDAKNQGAYEPIFYNKDGLITECAIRNIFFIKEKTLITPSLDLGVLPGIMRNTIIEIAKNLNIKVEETLIPFELVNDMDEAFISSTGVGLLPCYWDNWESNYQLTNTLLKRLNKLIDNSCK